jgi:single-strand DNA-binding protein
MRGINKVILIGNVGQDPEIRFTPSGSPVASLSLATDDSYKDRQTGQMVSVVDWHKVVVFGKLAEIVQNYVKAGSKLYVEGKQKTRKWQDKDGNDRSTTEVVLDIKGTLQMMDPRVDDNTSPLCQPSCPVGDFA